MVVGVEVTNVYTISLGCTYVILYVCIMFLFDDIKQLLKWKFGYGSKLLLRSNPYYPPVYPMLILVSHGFIPKSPISVCVHYCPKAFGLHESDATDFFVFRPFRDLPRTHDERWVNDGKMMIIIDYLGDLGKGCKRHIQLHSITSQVRI